MESFLKKANKWNLPGQIPRFLPLTFDKGPTAVDRLFVACQSQSAVIGPGGNFCLHRLNLPTGKISLGRLFILCVCLFIYLLFRRCATKEAFTLAEAVGASLTSSISFPASQAGSSSSGGGGVTVD